MANRYPLVIVNGEIQQLQSADKLVDPSSNNKFAFGLIGAGIAWTFDTSTVSADPGTGNIRLDNASFSSVAHLYLSQNQYNGTSVKTAVLTWDDSNSAVRAWIKITKDATDTSFIIFQLTGAITDNTTWLSMPVTYLTGSGSFSASDTLRVEAFRTGDVGSAGPTGNSYATTIGDGATNPITVNHALGSSDLFVSIREVSTGSYLDATITVVDINNISLTFAVIPTAGQYRVVVSLGGGATGQIFVPVIENDYGQSYTVPTTGLLPQPNRLALSGTERLTLAGTGRAAVCDAPTDVISQGAPDQEQYAQPSFTLMPDKFIPIYARLQLNSSNRATLVGNSRLIVSDLPSPIAVSTAPTAPRVANFASAAVYTPNIATTDIVEITALAVGITINTPIGTPFADQKIIFRFKDNGGAQTISFTTGATNSFRAGTDIALPTTTVISKTLYVGFMFNAADSRFDLLALVNNI